MLNRTLEGHWWQPGEESDKIAGIATFEGSDLTLRLLGAFMKRNQTRPNAFSLEPVEHIPMLYGSCEGKLITILNARTSNFKVNVAGDTQARQTLNAAMMLVGIWLDEPDEQCFESLTVGVDNLLEWAAHSGVKDVVEQPEGGGTQFLTSWRSVDSVAAQVGDAEISLGFTGTTRHRTRLDGKESIIAERAWFRITPAQPAGARAMLERWASPLQDLVSFAMDAPCALGDVELRWRPPAAERSEDEESGEARSAKVAVYFTSVYASRPDAKPVYRFDALFTARDAPFETLMPAWFEACERFGPVVGMLLGLRYVERTYVENRVITSVAAAEGLHRRLLPEETYVSTDDFDALTATLTDAVPDKHRNWLTDRLWNEPSLNKRLQQLAEQLPAAATAPFLPKPSRWSRRTTDTRNWLVHRFELENPPDGAEMYVLSRLTSSVLTLLLMQVLGLDEAHLARVADEQKSFRWLAIDGQRLAPWVFGAPPRSGSAK